MSMADTDVLGYYMCYMYPTMIHLLYIPPRSIHSDGCRVPDKMLVFEVNEKSVLTAIKLPDSTEPM